MNSRELAIISTATLLGALASAITVRFFFNPKKHFSTVNSTSNGVVGTKSSPQSPFDPAKRKGYLSWDDYFMAIAFLSAERSKDPNRLVHACQALAIMDFLVVVLMTGFLGQRLTNAIINGNIIVDKLVLTCPQTFQKSKTGDPLETKYPYVCHAEMNAILNTNHASAVGQRLYVTMFPCNECAKIIIQSGVSEVIYCVEKKLENSETTYVASHKLLSMAGLKVRRHQPRMDQILIKFKEL